MMLSPGAILAIRWVLIWPVVAGFFAVYIYHRRTGQSLTVRGGVRIGWITGVFYFLIALVMFTLSLLAMVQEGKFVENIRHQMSISGAAGADVQQFIRVLESPSGTAVIVGMMLVFLFMMFAGLPVLGGALCAKVLERE